MSVNQGVINIGSIRHEPSNSSMKFCDMIEGEQLKNAPKKPIWKSGWLNVKLCMNNGTKNIPFWAFAEVDTSYSQVRCLHVYKCLLTRCCSLICNLVYNLHSPVRYMYHKAQWTNEVLWSPTSSNWRHHLISWRCPESLGKKHVFKYHRTKSRGTGRLEKWWTTQAIYPKW